LWRFGTDQYEQYRRQEANSTIQLPISFFASCGTTSKSQLEEVEVTAQMKLILYMGLSENWIPPQWFH
jgi:hypothetical protein